MLLEVKPVTQSLNDLQKWIDGVTDAQGMSVDEGIKETVVLLNAFGLRTNSSCQGHPDDNESTPTPWVRIYPEEPTTKDWTEDDSLRSKVQKQSRQMRLKLLSLLDEFYHHRQVPYDVMLTTENIGFGFRLQNKGLPILEELPLPSQKEKISYYKKEMIVFTKFLKNKFDDCASTQ